MEFSQKLQELRHRRGLSQAELAEALFVSRTAVSKWESGRGLPGIDSLKAIAKYFSVSVDDLLSGEELLTIADEDGRQRATHLCDLVFGLLDCGVLLLLFLPLFAARGDGAVRSVSLLTLAAPLYVRIPAMVLVVGIALSGVLTLALQNSGGAGARRWRHRISVGLGALATAFFMLTLQPYAALILFLFLIVKVSLLVGRA